VLLPVIVCLVLGASASTALAAPVFHPRVGNALGLAPPVNKDGEASLEPTELGVFTPVLYHGGQTMNGGVTVHVIFWGQSSGPFSFPDSNPAVPNTVTNPNGGLVSLTIPVGEADAVSPFSNPLGLATGIPFNVTGFPTCSADLGLQTVTCTGLVPGEVYTLSDGGQTVSGAADGNGALTEPMTIHRGDTVALNKSAPRTLTTLRVANLQVSIDDANPGVVNHVDGDRSQRRHPDPDHPVRRAVGGATGAAGAPGAARTSRTQAQDHVHAREAQQDQVHGQVPEGQGHEGHGGGGHHPWRPHRRPRPGKAGARQRDAEPA
jgi:hypothetical protein